MFLDPNQQSFWPQTHLDSKTLVSVLGTTKEFIASNALSGWGTTGKNKLAEAEQDYHNSHVVQLKHTVQQKNFELPDQASVTQF